MNAHVTLITGPRASGKSTFAAEFHQALAGSVPLCADDPFHQVMDVNRERWIGRETELYAVILRHELALARDLALEGCCVIVDATVLPGQVAPLQETPAPEVSIVVLLPPLEECLANEHRSTRTVLVREEKVRTTWQEMQEWRAVPGLPVHIVDGTEPERRKTLSAMMEEARAEL